MTYAFCSTLDTARLCNEAYQSCEWIQTDDPTDCDMPTEEPTYEPTVRPTPDGCCAGWTDQTRGFCHQIETEDECSGFEVCFWILTDDVSVCAPPTEDPTAAPSRSPLIGYTGCCTTDNPQAWADCSVLEDENGCNVFTGAECYWFATTDPEECPVPGCCRIRPETFPPFEAG